MKNKNTLLQLITSLSLLPIVISSHGKSLEEFCSENVGKDFVELSSVHAFTDEGAIADMKQFCELALGMKNREVDVINKAIQPWMSPDSGLAFLKDIDFKIKAFENDSETAGNGLGFSYDYAKVVPLNEYRYTDSNNTITGFSANFKATGTIAVDENINPANFLDTRLSVSGFSNRGGVTQQSAQNSVIYFTRLNELEDQAANAQTQEELKKMLAVKENILDEVRSSLGSRSYLEIDFNVGLESDQQFDQSQWSYGGQLALDYKSYNRDAWQSQFNIFDWPFALLRMFTGYNPSEQGFQPYGSTIPTLVLAYDQVNPNDNTAREAVGETSRFDRYRTEIFFRTPIAFIGKSEVWFNFDWRTFHEIDASNAIKAANLDEFNYRTISISSTSGIFVSYRKGRLPFDVEDQRAYEVGWKFNFGQ